MKTKILITSTIILLFILFYSILSYFRINENKNKTYYSNIVDVEFFNTTTDGDIIKFQKIITKDTILFIDTKIKQDVNGFRYIRLILK